MLLTPSRAVLVRLLAFSSLLAAGCATPTQIKPNQGQPGVEPVASKPRPDDAVAASPAFENLLTLDNEPTSLSAHRKQVTVLVFWATYCAPCIEEMPFVEALYQKYKADPEVAILSVAVDPTKDPAAFEGMKTIVKERGLTAPVLVDSELKLIRHLSGLIPSRSGTAPGSGESAELSFALPLNAIVDQAFKAHLFVGLEEDLTQDRYLDRLSGLIELGRAGRLPDSPLRAAAPEAFADGQPERLMMKIPKNLTLEQRLAKSPDIRAILKKTFAHLTQQQLEELMKQVEVQLRAGNVISLEIQAPNKPN